MKFNLQAPYQPAGDQPKAIKHLSKLLKSSKAKAVLMGVTGSGKTMTMASVIEKLNRPTLVMTHNKTLAAQLYREFKDFFPENLVEYFISYYDYYQPEAYVPTSNTYIAKEADVNKEIEILRLKATSSLIERKDVIIVASVSAIYGLGSPETYQKSVLILEEGQQIKREDVLEKLLHIQYTRNDIQFARSTFRVRGDTIEILPAYLEEGVRIEFFGDKIEQLSKFDPLTGNIKIKLSLIAIYPAKHFITETSQIERAVTQIKEELQEQIAFFKSENKPLEEERIQQRTLFDIEMLKEMGYCNGIENYSRHLIGREAGSRPECLLDYFPDNFLTIIDESHATIPQIRGMFEGDRSRKQTLINFGFRLPSALDNRPLNFVEFKNLAQNVLYVSATPMEYELDDAQEIVEQIIRPTGLLDPIISIYPTKNQMSRLTDELKKTIKKKERALITTLTKRMAEDLTEYLSNQDFRVKYMHSDINSLERVEILRDLRKGEFDILVGINLLREGLDLPEVSLVVILDADKEGFLRSSRSLIQTMGRAARNANGKVIMIADQITKSMKHAISETKRRRNIQETHNKKMGITPTTIQKAVVDIIKRESKEETKEIKLFEKIKNKYASDKFTTMDNRTTAIKEAMFQAAEELDFEKAAILRDLLQHKKPSN